MTGPTVRDTPFHPTAPIQWGPGSPIASIAPIVSSPTFAVGKFTVSPLVASLPCGRYAASVSLRSGQGRASHDRVLRFDTDFHDRESAIVFAAAQGRAWLAEHYGQEAAAGR